MRFGICLNLQSVDSDSFANALAVREAGAAYLELPLAPQTALDDTAFTEGPLRALAACGLPCRACNVFFPGSMRLTGQDADHDAAIAYARTALPRAAALGARIVVFGSGGARNVPSGFSKDKATGQLAGLLRALGPIAGDHGIVLAIEPLNRGESNIINTLGEAVALARAANHPAIAALIDYYHLRLSDEPIDAIADAGPLLAHAHIARPLGRKMPFDLGEEPYDAFFRALSRAGYAGDLSLEAGTPDDFPTDTRRALDVLRMASAMVSS